jgi:hypothetical protein
MIIIIIGGIGQGKSLTAARMIAQSKNFAYTNFKVKEKLPYHRLNFQDIFLFATNEKTSKKTIMGINFDFWNTALKKKNFSIYIDEVHNYFHARTAMTKLNIWFSKWYSQIRKVLQDSEQNHLVLITQSLRKIDIDARELASIIIECHKYSANNIVIIRLSYYDGAQNYELGRKSKIEVFEGNDFFKFYDSLELLGDFL